MKINENISYATLKGLSERATDTEKLWIADEWLRANKQVSIPQYRVLRSIWNIMCKKYGTWKVIIRCGSVKHQYATGTYDEMYQLCKDSHWRHNHNNGCWWDMELDMA
jgi:hypothetical protein